MKLTLAQVKAMNPCEDGLSNLEEVLGGRKEITTDLIQDENAKLVNVCWLLKKVLPEDSQVLARWELWNAKQVAHLVEDVEIHNCLQVTEDYLDGKVDKETLNMSILVIHPIVYSIIVPPVAYVAADIVYNLANNARTFPDDEDFVAHETARALNCAYPDQDSYSTHLTKARQKLKDLVDREIGK